MNARTLSRGIVSAVNDVLADRGSEEAKPNKRENSARTRSIAATTSERGSRPPSAATADPRVLYFFMSRPRENNDRG